MRPRPEPIRHTLFDPEQDPSPREECGVFGVWAPGEEVAKLSYYGLYALQHRGQEAAGIAVADGSQIVVFKDLGLVSQVFDEQTLSSLNGHIAVGHCRYSTTGSGTWENAQPTFAITDVGSGIALGHNGNLVNTVELAAKVAALPGKAGRGKCSTDSDVITRLLAAKSADSGLRGGGDGTAARPCRARSAWCSATSTPCTPPATRTAYGRWCWAGWTAAG